MGNTSTEEEIAKIRQSFEEQADKNKDMSMTLKKAESREKKLMMKLKPEVSEKECMTDIGANFFDQREEFLNNNSSTAFGTVNPNH